MPGFQESLVVPGLRSGWVDTGIFMSMCLTSL